MGDGLSVPGNGKIDARADARIADWESTHGNTARHMVVTNEDNEIEGPIVATKGTAAEIEAEVGTEGEIYYKTDTKKFGVFDGVTPGGTECGAIGSVGSMVMVEPKTSATANAAALRVAYALAKTLTPYGNAISATNPIYIILYPGIYNYGTGDANNHGLEMDTPYIHLVGMSSNTESVWITSQISTFSRGTIEQTADNVSFSNLTIENTASGLPDSSIFMGMIAISVESARTYPAAYFPEDKLSGTVMRNVKITSPRLDNYVSSYALPTRAGINYSGNFYNLICTAAGMGFGRGEFSGVWDGGYAADYCLGGNILGKFSGTIKNMSCGNYVGSSQAENGSDYNTGNVFNVDAGTNFMCGRSSMDFSIDDSRIVSMRSNNNAGYTYGNIRNTHINQFSIKSVYANLTNVILDSISCDDGETPYRISFRGVLENVSCLDCLAELAVYNHCTNCKFKATTLDHSAIFVYNTITTPCIYNCVFIANGIGYPINASAARNAKIAGCIMNQDSANNLSIHANVTNLIATPYNVSDANVTL